MIGYWFGMVFISFVVNHGDRCNLKKKTGRYFVCVGCPFCCIVNEASLADASDLDGCCTLR